MTYATHALMWAAGVLTVFTFNYIIDIYRRYK